MGRRIAGPAHRGGQVPVGSFQDGKCDTSYRRAAPRPKKEMSRCQIVLEFILDSVGIPSIVADAVKRGFSAEKRNGLECSRLACSPALPNWDRRMLRLRRRMRIPLRKCFSHRLLHTSIPICSSNRNPPRRPRRLSFRRHLALCRKSCNRNWRSVEDTPRRLPHRQHFSISISVATRDKRLLLVS